METLMDSASGTFWITTWSGARYLIDLDSSSLTRFPCKVRADPNIALWLRSDETPVALLHIADCTVGRPGRFVVDLAIPGIPFTVRTTTTVESIESSLTVDSGGNGDD
jgi:hypothetical protein